MSDKQIEINSFATEDPHLANCLEKAGLFVGLTLTAMGFAKKKKKKRQTQMCSCGIATSCILSW